ncbi:MAG: hypothetical protein KDD25_05855, partial [Bdellovibrionales bacterium]|nr:hypothetical protein [Bdellovibrionales bacterium]
LWMVKRVFFGEEGELVAHGLKDLNKRELGLMVPLVVMILWMGVLPNHFLSWSEASVDHFVKNAKKYELTILEKTEELRVVEAKQ